MSDAAAAMFLLSGIGPLIVLVIMVGLVLLPFLLGGTNGRLTRLLSEAKRQNQLLEEQNRILKDDPVQPPTAGRAYPSPPPKPMARCASCGTQLDRRLSKCQNCGLKIAG